MPGCGLALALGVWGVRRGGTMWRDEAVTYDVARRPLADLWRLLADADAVHGVHYLLVHGLFAVLPSGADPLLVLRVPSVLATVVAAVGVTRLGVLLAGPSTGAWAGVVFAVLPQVQRYAQEGRSYAVVCALVVWATYALLRGRWITYAALLLAACALHEFAVLAVVAHAPVVPRARWRPFARSAGAVVAGVAPLAGFSLTQSAQVEWIAAVDGWGLLWFGVAAGVSVIGVRAGAPRPLVRLGRGLALLPAALLMAAAPLKPLYVDRYVLYGCAGLALLAGAALARLRCRSRAAVAVVCVLALLPVAWELRTPGGRKDDVAAVAAAVREVSRPGDAVVYLPSRRRVWSVTGGSAGLRDIGLAASPVASGTLYGVEVPAPVLRERMLREPRIVVVGDRGEVPGRGFRACRVLRPHGGQVALYARRGVGGGGCCVGECG
ncbi:hypothetical protein GTY65_01070 [Streptomyces sp. SID8379]|nr:hypothetical protein [Streptomyces sp. SID8379]MYW62677.1 hypothetical protein [Streptomyces sp. SID8379]